MSVLNVTFAVFAVLISIEEYTYLVKGHETKETKEAKKMISKKYNQLYTQQCSTVYDKLKKFADDCTIELQMTNEHVDKCVNRVKKPRPKPKVKPMPSNGTDTANSTQPPVDSTTPQNIVISDNDSSPTSSALTDPHSWYHIWGRDNKVVHCYIRWLQKTDEYKGMSKEEWTETRNKLYIEKLQAKMDCILKKTT